METVFNINNSLYMCVLRKYGWGIWRTVLNAFLTWPSVMFNNMNDINIKARNSLCFALFLHGMSITGTSPRRRDFNALILHWTVWINDRQLYYPMRSQLVLFYTLLIVIGQIRPDRQPNCSITHTESLDPPRIDRS